MDARFDPTTRQKRANVGKGDTASALAVIALFLSAIGANALRRLPQSC